MENETTNLLDIVIWSGAALSLLGLLAIFWCIFKITRAKRAQLDDEAMRAVLKSAVPLNLGALMLSMLGLIMVGVGIALS
ncbi:MAG: hypothetical protein ACSHWZ_06585 [Sulfitobacter sp.]